MKSVFQKMENSSTLDFSQYYGTGLMYLILYQLNNYHAEYRTKNMRYFSNHLLKQKFSQQNPDRSFTETNIVNCNLLIQTASLEYFKQQMQQEKNPDVKTIAKFIYYTAVLIKLRRINKSEKNTNINGMTIREVESAIKKLPDVLPNSLFGEVEEPWAIVGALPAGPVGG